MKKRKRGKEKEPVVNNVSNIVDIDYDKLADAIVRAHSRIEEEKVKIHDKDADEWDREIGRKDYVGHPIRQFFNSFGCVFRALFLSRKKVQTTRTTYILIQTATEYTFSALKWLLYIITVVALTQTVVFGARKEWVSMIVSIIICLSVFMVARLFRLAGVEVRNMKNREEILAVSSSVASSVAVILAIIAIILQVVIK